MHASPSSLLTRRQIMKLSSVSSFNYSKEINSAQFLSTIDHKAKLPTLFYDSSIIKKDKSLSIDSASSKRAMRQPLANRSLSSTMIQGSFRELPSTSSVIKQSFECLQASRDKDLQRQKDKNAQLKLIRDHVSKTWKTKLEMKHKKQALVIKLVKYRTESERKAMKIDEYKKRHESCYHSRKERVLLAQKNEFHLLMKRIRIKNEEASVGNSKGNADSNQQKRGKPCFKIEKGFGLISLLNRKDLVNDVSKTAFMSYHSNHKDKNVN